MKTFLNKINGSDRIRYGVSLTWVWEREASFLSKCFDCLSLSGLLKPLKY